MPCCRSSDRYRPSCLAGRASTGFIPGRRPNARPTCWFSCRDGSRPIRPTIAHFHQYFHQMLKYFIIFTNITINSTYIQVITIPTIYFHQAATGPTVGTGHARAVCLGGGLGMAWFLRTGWPGLDGHCVMSFSGRAKSPSHQATVCMTIYVGGAPTHGFGGHTTEVAPPPHRRGTSSSTAVPP